MSEPDLSQVDPEVASLIRKEAVRQHEKVRLIPSENYASRAVLEASGSVLSNKYSEESIGNWMADVIAHSDDEALLSRVAAAVRELCDNFPAPGIGAHPSA